MPTLIGHAIAGVALGTAVVKKKQWLKVIMAAIFCTVIPDADVIAFKFGIPYGHTFGHRGFTHSVTFSILLGILVAVAFQPKSSKEGLKYFLLFFLCTLSHSLLDACTNGGLGVALFSPFSNHRYFFPWQPIEVAPLNIKKFLSARGVTVLKSEFTWVMSPSLFLGLIIFVGRLWIKPKPELSNSSR